MNIYDLKETLNNIRAPQYTRATDLQACTPYRVVKFERCTTRFGETVATTLEGLVGHDFFLRVYLPNHFMKDQTDEMIEHYNSEEGPRMSLQNLGRGKGIEFV